MNPGPKTEEGTSYLGLPANSRLSSGTLAQKPYRFCDAHFKPDCPLCRRPEEPAGPPQADVAVPGQACAAPIRGEVDVDPVVEMAIRLADAKSRVRLLAVSVSEQESKLKSTREMLAEAVKNRDMAQMTLAKAVGQETRSMTTGQWSPCAVPEEQPSPCAKRPTQAEPGN